MLEFEVVKIRGYCPLYNVGDKLLIDYPRIVMDKDEPLCTNALSSLMRYVQDLEKGVDPEVLGLTNCEDMEHAFIECKEDSKLYSNCGTVTFRCRRLVETGPQRRWVEAAVGSRVR